VRLVVAGVFDLGIDLDVWPWIWLGTAVVFALVELILVGGSFIVLPWAASAFVAAILAFYDAPIEAQWLVFVFGGAALFVLMYRWARKFMRTAEPTPGVGADRLVGLVGIVTAPITPDDVDRRGRVQIGGEQWAAISDGAVAIDIGARVKVLAMRGTRVVVEALQNGDR
jgi:membrane protein implicated in regulation of membrane protease activity